MSLISFSTLVLIWSRISLILAMLWPLGSSNSQSSVSVKVAGQAFSAPHPMVITLSAWSSISTVSFLGWLLLISKPASFVICTTFGSIILAGLVPAEVALAFPWARWLKRASAIWLRPELPTQTNRIFFILKTSQMTLLVFSPDLLFISFQALSDFALNQFCKGFVFISNWPDLRYGDNMFSISSHNIDEEGDWSRIIFRSDIGIIRVIKL